MKLFHQHQIIARSHQNFHYWSVFLIELNCIQPQKFCNDEDNKVLKTRPECNKTFHWKFLNKFRFNLSVAELSLPSYVSPAWPQNNNKNLNGKQMVFKHQMLRILTRVCVYVSSLSSLLLVFALGVETRMEKMFRIVWNEIKKFLTYFTSGYHVRA